MGNILLIALSMKNYDRMVESEKESEKSRKIPKITPLLEKYKDINNDEIKNVER